MPAEHKTPHTKAAVFKLCLVRGDVVCKAPYRVGGRQASHVAADGGRRH